MHFVRTRKRLTAWLGLVAMVLVLFAPAVSQALASHVLQASFEQTMPLCEANPVASATTDLPAEHGMPADHHAACGYCDLLAEHVLVPTVIPPMAVPVPSYVSTWTAVPERLVAREARRAGRPRDSPFFI